LLCGAHWAARHSGYFNDELIDPKFVFSVEPIPLTAVMITTLMPTAMRQYSIAVAPDSSLRNLEISRIAKTLPLAASPGHMHGVLKLEAIGCEVVDKSNERPIKLNGKKPPDFS
jgi:hypothetical protein